MIDATQAVFLIYASSRSRGTEAAKRICEALRAAMRNSSS